MESAFLTFILVISFAVFSSHCSITDWDDVVVAKKGKTITLVCVDTTLSGAININWRVKSLYADVWKLLLSAGEREAFSGGASKLSMHLIDPNFQVTGNFSLSFIPTMEDFGLYSCLIRHQKREMEKIILLAILTVTIVPPAPIPQHSTLRLIASVNPDNVISKITWAAPGDIFMKSEEKQNVGTVAKLPKVQISDNGPYVCMVHPRGNSSKPLFAFNVDVIVDADKVVSFTNITHGPMISNATQAQTLFHLTCPSVPGDYVLIYWQPPDTSSSMKLVFQYDRWRGSTLSTGQSKNFQLAGPPYNAEAWRFSFFLTPGLKEGGLYVCDVLLNDNAFSQWTELSVLKGIDRSLSFHSCEAENIYENPEDVRQAPPQDSVYMDLKPRGEDDVYKELERYEQCQS
ncbi:g6f-like [Scomber scombrus]|uniref:G6f-like n=1 Tax=Scomber scombrus TaxID=13677 RepID=A0AAV1P331_SCOSC